MKRPSIQSTTPENSRVLARALSYEAVLHPLSGGSRTASHQSLTISPQEPEEPSLPCSELLKYVSASSVAASLMLNETSRRVCKPSRSTNSNAQLRCGQLVTFPCANHGRDLVVEADESD